MFILLQLPNADLVKSGVQGSAGQEKDSSLSQESFFGLFSADSDIDGSIESNVVETEVDGSNVNGFGPDDPSKPLARPVALGPTMPVVGDVKQSAVSDYRSDQREAHPFVITKPDQRSAALMVDKLVTQIDHETPVREPDDASLQRVALPRPELETASDTGQVTSATPTDLGEVQTAPAAAERSLASSFQSQNNQYQIVSSGDLVQHDQIDAKRQESEAKDNALSHGKQDKTTPDAEVAGKAVLSEKQPKVSNDVGQISPKTVVGNRGFNELRDVNLVAAALPNLTQRTGGRSGIELSGDAFHPTERAEPKQKSEVHGVSPRRALSAELREGTPAPQRSIHSPSTLQIAQTSGIPQTGFSNLIYGTQIFDHVVGKEVSLESQLPVPFSANGVEQTSRVALTESGRSEPIAARSIVTQVIQSITRVPSEGSIELRLQPEELGRVRLTMLPTEGGVTIQVSAERADTLDLLRRNIDVLEADLKGQGLLNLDFTFGSGLSDDAKTSREEDNSTGEQIALDGEDRQLSIEIAIDPAQAVGNVGSLDIRV